MDLHRRTHLRYWWKWTSIKSWTSFYYSTYAIWVKIKSWNDTIKIKSCSGQTTTIAIATAIMKTGAYRKPSIAAVSFWLFITCGSSDDRTKPLGNKSTEQRSSAEAKQKEKKENRNITFKRMGTSEPPVGLFGA